VNSFEYYVGDFECDCQDGVGGDDGWEDSVLEGFSTAVWGLC
jgi:hypothetical protein